MDQQRVGFLSDFVWSHLLTGYFLFEIETQDLFLMRCNYNNSIIPRQAASSCFCSSGLGNSRINSIAWVFSTNERKCCVFVRVSVCVCVCACQYHLRETIADINVPFWYVIFRKGGLIFSWSSLLLNLHLQTFCELRYNLHKWLSGSFALSSSLVSTSSWGKYLFL